MFWFQALSPCDYKNVMRVVETAILSTDLAMYFKKKSKFLELVDNGEFDWQSQEKKECKQPNYLKVLPEDFHLIFSAK